ncbi:MAG: hypothetical protein CMJ75_06905 [Planctomycetaceae bacterium]|nr:hypothetical protein [Planctomycetaceae bacterium]
MVPLKGLTNLKSLNVQGTQVTDTGSANLQKTLTAARLPSSLPPPLFFGAGAIDCLDQFRGLSAASRSLQEGGAALETQTLDTKHALHRKPADLSGSRGRGPARITTDWVS